MKQAMSSRKRFLSLVLAAVICLAAVPSLLGQVTVTAADPSAAAPGTVNLNVTISGSGFKRGATAKFLLSGTTNPGDVAVTGTSYVSSSQMVATISVASMATDATYDVAVTNTNGSSGKGTELFGVNSSANKDGSIKVTSTLYDTDALSNQLLLRSDNYLGSAGQATYTAPSVISEVSLGLWDLDLRNQTTRVVWVTLSHPASGSSPSPIADGYYAARVMTRCYDASNNIFSLFAIPVGTTNNRCSLRVNLFINGATYGFVMAPIFPGTGYANVTCVAGINGCTSWHVEPNLDSVNFPGNVPRVAQLETGGKGNKIIVLGYYYNNYRIDFHE